MRAQAVRTRRGPATRRTSQGLYRTSANERSEWTCQQHSTPAADECNPWQYLLVMAVSLVAFAASLLYYAQAVRLPQ